METKNSLKRLLEVFLFLTFLICCLASDAPETGGGHYPKTAGPISFIVFCFTAGPLFTFLGFRLAKTVTFLSGFGVGSLLGFMLMSNLEPHIPNFDQHRDLILALTPYLIGIVCGLVALWLLKAALCLIGALGGFGVAMFLLAWKTGGIIDDEVGRPAFIAGCCVGGALLTFFFEKPLIILMTSIIGSMLVGAGIDILIDGSLAHSIKQFLTNGSPIEVNEKTFAVLGTVAGLTALGILVQFFATCKFKKAFFDSAGKSDHRRVSSRGRSKIMV